MLKKASNFVWMTKFQKAFDELKTYLSIPPLLDSPGDAKPLSLFLTTLNNAMVIVLVKEEYDL